MGRIYFQLNTIENDIAKAIKEAAEAYKEGAWTAMQHDEKTAQIRDPGKS